ncbi:zinc finger, CCHC-type containing protein, partial [Tanacetum coccineum]
DFNRLIAVAEEKIHGKEIDLEICSELIDGMGMGVLLAFALVCEAPMCLIRIAVGNAISGFIMKTQAIDDQDPLVNYNNDNENDDLGYQSEEYFDEVKSAAAKMARSKSVYQHTMGRSRYALVKEKMIEKKEIEPDEEPVRGTLWLKGMVNKDREYTDDEIRSAGDKLKETEDKIKEGTLKVDHGTDAMTVVLVNLIMRDANVKKKNYYPGNLSNQLCQQTEGMVTKLKNQLATQGVSPVDINPINSSADEEAEQMLLVCGNYDRLLYFSLPLAAISNLNGKKVRAHNPSGWRQLVSIAAASYFPELDVLISITIASDLYEGPTCRPLIVDTSSENEAPFISAKNLGHPVLRNDSLCDGTFVPNDVCIGGSDYASFILLTGPNMGGKSTLLSQVCLAVILAQVGADVPAESFKMSPVDRNFVRMGAKDHIMAGQSTFLTELLETASTLIALALSTVEGYPGYGVKQGENMTTLVENNSVFRSFFEKQKLTGPNFIDWYRQLWLVLSTEDKEKYLEQPILVAPVAVAPDQPIPPAALTTYNEWVKNQKEIVVMMLLTMDLEIQQNLAHLGANDMLIELKALYSKQEKQELLQTLREFHTCKQEEGQYNYNMHSMGKTVNELHAMLKLHEETLPKKVDAPALHAIRAGKVQKNKNKKPSKAAKGVQRKGKGKKAYANAEPSYFPKPKNPPPPKKDNPAKDAICHHCDKVGCGTHICNTTQGLRGSKKLNTGALSLYMGNGQCAAVEAIGNYHLCLPSGLVIVLNNCHYAPSITRGIVSVSHLYDDGFINRFELNNAISVSKKNVVYFSAIPRDGVYEIEKSCSNTNDSSIWPCGNMV